MFKTLKFQIPALFWLVVILVFCFADLSGVDQGHQFFFDGFDKMVHLGFFFIFSILLLHGSVKSKKAYSFTLYTLIKLFFITALIGAAIEVIQYYVFPVRSAEWWDFVCDMLGVAMAAFSFVVLHYQYFNVEKS